MSMRQSRVKTVFEFYHSKLVKSWYPYWTEEIRKRIPADFTFSDDEIDSEITHQCQYLSQIFKGGDFPAYCNQYVVKRSVNAIWKEYAKLNHADIANAFREFDEGEDYTEKHVIVAENVAAISSEDDRHEKTRLMTQVYEAAIELDRITEGYYQFANIVDDYRMGMSLEEIAEELGTYKMEVSRRLAKLRNYVNERNHK